MIDRTKLLGQEAEEVACAFLQKQGLKLIKRNFRCALGEIDLIMHHQQSIVFVEVRYRRNSLYGDPIESVIKRKQQKLMRAALFFLQQQKWTQSLNYRFDIVGLNGPTGLNWIQNAFEMKLGNS